MSIKVNEPYEGSSIYSQYMNQLQQMSDIEVKKEYFRLKKLLKLNKNDFIKKSIVVDFIVRYHKEYLLKER